MLTGLVRGKSADFIKVPCVLLLSLLLQQKVTYRVTIGS